MRSVCFKILWSDRVNVAWEPQSRYTRVTMFQDPLVGSCECSSHNGGLGLFETSVSRSSGRIV